MGTLGGKLGVHVVLCPGKPQVVDVKWLTGWRYLWVMRCQLLIITSHLAGVAHGAIVAQVSGMSWIILLRLGHILVVFVGYRLSVWVKVITQLESCDFAWLPPLVADHGGILGGPVAPKELRC